MYVYSVFEIEGAFIRNLITYPIAYYFPFMYRLTFELDRRTNLIFLNSSLFSSLFTFLLRSLPIESLVDLSSVPHRASVIISTTENSRPSGYRASFLVNSSQIVSKSSSLGNTLSLMYFDILTPFLLTISFSCLYSISVKTNCTLTLILSTPHRNRPEITYILYHGNCKSQGFPNINFSN